MYKGGNLSVSSMSRLCVPCYGIISCNTEYPADIIHWMFQICKLAIATIILLFFYANFQKAKSIFIFLSKTVKIQKQIDRGYIDVQWNSTYCPIVHDHWVFGKFGRGRISERDRLCMFFTPIDYPQIAEYPMSFRLCGAWVKRTLQTILQNRRDLGQYCFPIKLYIHCQAFFRQLKRSS